MMDKESIESSARGSAIVASAIAGYTVLYLLYLWFFLAAENELTHWLTLVLLPFALLWGMLARTKDQVTFRSLLEEVGFAPGRLAKGILWGVVWGLVLGALQAGVSNKRELIWQAITSGSVLYKLPLAFGLMLLTAGFTEEFFFRGVLQTSLARAFRRNWPAVIISGIFFGVYHFPYAFLLPSWPSHGNVTAAITEGVVMQAIIGFVLGAIYARTRHIIAPIICHSLFNAVWAMTVIDFPFQ